MNVFAVVAFTLSVFTFIFDLLMVAMPWWVTESDTAHSGLWEYCVSVNSDNHVCLRFSTAGQNTEAWHDASAAMEFIGLLFAFIGMVAGSVLLFCLQTKSKVYLLAWVCEFVSAFFVALGVIIFMCNNSLSDLHVCFYFALIGLILAAVAGIFFLLAKKVMSSKDF